MWPESSEQAKPLKTGWTTGSCATACVLACGTWLLGKKQLDVVTISLPKGQLVEFKIEHSVNPHFGHQCATIKDAGDDPDITHGAKVFASVQLQTEPGVHFKAASGVGIVTKPGLQLGIGEPAINPTPRKMMSLHLQVLAEDHGYRGGFLVSVGVENGEQLALKTMNPRLGIHGGLSILGTSGIVRPFSCAAYIASIYQGVDVAVANGYLHLGASTGNTSEQALKKSINFADTALIEMGDFVGALLKQVKKYPVTRLSVCGGVGKMSKLADGHFDLHSSRSNINFTLLAKMAQQLGASQMLQQQISQANTSIQAIKLAKEQGIKLSQVIAEQALQQIQGYLQRELHLELWLVDRQGEVLAYASNQR